MNKTKHIKILFLILACLCIFSSCSSSPGWVTDKTEIIIGESEKFSREEIEQAIEVVKNQGDENSEVTLLLVRYDESRSKVVIDSYMDRKNIIVLFSDFKTYGEHAVLNPYTEYTDYQWKLIRENENSAWAIYDKGFIL